MVEYLLQTKNEELMNMWKESFAMFFVMMFAITGVSILAVCVHEYSHFNDFRALNVSNQQICALMLPTEYKNLSDFLNSPIGLYSFSTNESDSSIYQEIDAHTEMRAYIIGSGMFVLFLICFFIVIWAQFKREVKIMEMGWEIEEKDIYIKQLEVQYHG